MRQLAKGLTLSLIRICYHDQRQNKSWGVGDPIALSRAFEGFALRFNTASIMEGFSVTGKHADELRKTASALVRAGKGILAADESSGTVGKRVSTSQI